LNINLFKQLEEIFIMDLANTAECQIITLDGEYIGFIDQRGGPTYVLDGASKFLFDALGGVRFHITGRSTVLPTNRTETGALVRAEVLRSEMNGMPVYATYEDYASMQRKYGTKPLNHPHRK
jgi:hypothetical protein